MNTLSKVEIKYASFLKKTLLITTENWWWKNQEPLIKLDTVSYFLHVEFLTYIALYDLDPVFREFTLQDKIKNLAKTIMKDPLIVQSMYIFKVPQSNISLILVATWNRRLWYLFSLPSFR